MKNRSDYTAFSWEVARMVVNSTEERGEKPDRNEKKHIQ